MFADAADENGAPVGAQLDRIAAKRCASGFFCRFSRHAIYNSLILSVPEDVQRNPVAGKSLELDNKLGPGSRAAKSIAWPG
jgi:hypothetical protein